MGLGIGLGIGLGMVLGTFHLSKPSNEFPRFPTSDAAGRIAAMFKRANTPAFSVASNRNPSKSNEGLRFSDILATTNVIILGQECTPTYVRQRTRIAHACAPTRTYAHFFVCTVFGGNQG